ncbi:MAG: organic solvent ABC transporter permease [Bdellovibrionales bacterium CG10_big_fil_rev_8_21_14_0_10_45_34]|nr:MAG: organic solvent ABC transporter permease [Bdellovibrionales bacterium CG10_big_fil_rev_8_21_14_0_10_45_34]
MSVSTGAGSSDTNGEERNSWDFSEFLDLAKMPFLKLGELSLFIFQAFRMAFRPPFRWTQFLVQLEFVANKSLLIVALTGMFTGMVFCFQSYLGFRMINAEGLIGATVALGIFRELGPVLTGLIISARAGGAMAAQLGTMRVTEQIDAMKIMGVSPIQYLVAPRVIAGVIATPLLTSFFGFVAMFGAHVMAVHVLHLDPAVFWSKVNDWAEPRDIVEGVIKGAVFGLIFSSVCTFKGFHTEGGAKGVGDATHHGVVISMVSIIIVDLFVTKLIRLYLAIM